MSPAPDIHLVFFDFGGVLADEGFHQGLRAIARKHGLDPQEFFETAVERIFATGYIVGQVDEAAWWDDLRQTTGVTGSDEALRQEILPRFTLKPRMMDVVQTLKDLGLRLAVLSDQTNWLDELDNALRFSDPFEQVFNSYHVGLHKRDPQCFRNALQKTGVAAENALFVDDARRNVDLARSEGLYVIHYQEQAAFEEELCVLAPVVTKALGCSAPLDRS